MVPMSTGFFSLIDLFFAIFHITYHKNRLLHAIDRLKDLMNLVVPSSLTHLPEDQIKFRDHGKEAATYVNQLAQYLQTQVANTDSPLAKVCLEFFLLFYQFFVFSFPLDLSSQYLQTQVANTDSPLAKVCFEFIIV
jgi:hypothetical protein